MASKDSRPKKKNANKVQPLKHLGRLKEAKEVCGGCQFSSEQVKCLIWLVLALALAGLAPGWQKECR